MKDFRGRTAVVTGAAGGIGLGLVRRFAVEGANVVMVDVDEAELERAEASLRQSGAAVMAAAADVGDPGAVADVADAAFARFGSVELLFCNAGVAGPSKGGLWETPAREWQRVLGVNTLGTTNLLNAFLPKMLAGGGGGHVVVTASMAAFSYGPVAAPYFVSKHAGLTLAEMLRRQLAAVGSSIGVSVLCPGAVSTRLIAREFDHQERQGASLADDEKQTALARLSEDNPEVMSPDAVADVVVDALRTERFYIFTHPSSLAGARSATQAVLDELNAVEA
ncbi:MAG: SDR family NAD(P)-dependent oxidoreductase [Actinobacteria bacterium]|nr:SDR family NAD(P)-dependent oxidoreductase [Actinomycetota bacterium]